MYVALSIHAQTEKTTFSCKDNCTLTKHTGRWTYSTRDFRDSALPYTAVAVIFFQLEALCFGFWLYKYIILVCIVSYGSESHIREGAWAAVLTNTYLEITTAWSPPGRWTLTRSPSCRCRSSVSVKLTSNTKLFLSYFIAQQSCQRVSKKCYFWKTAVFARYLSLWRISIVHIYVLH